MKKPKDILLSEKIKSLCQKRDLFVKKINKQINTNQENLEAICTHPEIKIVEKNYPGGYLNVAEYNKITMCLICGKELKRTTTHGGYG